MDTQMMIDRSFFFHGFLPFDVTGFYEFGMNSCTTIIAILHFMIS